MQSLRYHKYLPIACLYMFINAPQFFPHGLMFTSILSPFLYLWLLVKRRRFVLEIFLAVLFPFMFMNIVDKIVWKDFIISSLLLMTVYVSAYAIGVAIQEMRCLDQLMRTLIWINLCIALIGIPIRFTSYQFWMWQDPAISGSNLERFQGFVSEPSLYATLMMPLVMYVYWQFIRQRSWQNFKLGVAVLIPLLMALSYGSIAFLIASLAITHLIRGTGFRRLAWCIGAVTLLGLVFLLLPKTSRIKQRMIDIAQGTDQSTNERTVASYFAGYSMAKHKDLWFGVGLGEAKDVGEAYTNTSTGTTAGRVPATVPSQLGELGLVGMMLRFGLELYFFIKTKPYRNRYRLSIFVWVFLMQFVGSYPTDLGEYVLWILAFSKSVDVLSEPRAAPVKRKVIFRPVHQVA